MAARVNGEGLLLSDYEEELKRYQAGLSELGQDYDPAAAKEEVLKMMTDQMLLAQAAVKQGYTSDDAALQARYEELAAEAGGAEALTAWISQNFYSDESFRRALALDMAAVWMRNKILSEVPTTADQVRARQILVTDENEAFAVERRLQVGTSFETLAYEYDPLTGGDLGWFPAGYLLQPDVGKLPFRCRQANLAGSSRPVMVFMSYLLWSGMGSIPFHRRRCWLCSGLRLKSGWLMSAPKARSDAGPLKHCLAFFNFDPLRPCHCSPILPAG